MKRLSSERLGLVVLFVVLGLFLSLGTIVPRETTAVFASPDETAVALFARGWSAAEGFRLPTNFPGFLGDLVLHPRSMVQQGPWLVPVGFLGMPLLAMPFEQTWEGSAAFLTALLVASSVWPLWQFGSRLGRRAALVASVLYLTFPTVLLYANRGLFPNLPVVALGLWSVWLVGERAHWKQVVGGVVLGLALVVRPVEAVWLLPWVVWRVWKQKTWWIPTLAACAFPFVGYGASIQTYQSLVPTLGYWLNDIPASPSLVGGEAAAVMAVQTPSALPFGIHPRAMQTNIRLFWLEMLWPWVFLACAGLVQLWWRSARVVRSPVVWLGVWTSAVLFLFYGQGLYADNIRGTAALGNSFLRYMLPLVPLIALAGGAWAERMARNRSRTIVVTLLIGVLACFGVFLGLVRDEESILSTQQELRRYEEIRVEAARVLPSGTIVISERSDKLFAGLPGLIVVSPLPAAGVVAGLVEGARVAWFHRALTPEEIQEWLGVQVKVETVGSFGNEFLYLLTARYF